MSLELISRITERADADERLMVCLVSATRGSTPQKAGAIMLVGPDGRIEGTIGGGCVEAEVRSRALKQLVKTSDAVDDDTEANTATATTRESPQESNPATLMTFRLDRDYNWDDGLICGGVMEVVLQRIEGPDTMWSAAQATLTAGREATVRMAAVREAEADATQNDLTHDQIQIEMTFEPTPTLIIAGAGHVGGALAEMALSAGFAVSVIDDRRDAVNARFFDGCERICGEIDQTLAAMNLGPSSYVVIVTRGHQHDGQALGAVIGKPARYIGLIGSRRKVLTIYEALRDEGVPPEAFADLRAPIGLRLGAVTPHEIAVSILAELIATRRGEMIDPAMTMRLTPTQVRRATGEEDERDDD